MPYIVTGGAGFIGSHLVDRLVGSMRDTIVIDDLSSGNYINKRSKFIKQDLRRQVRINLPKGAGIFHLAANPSVKDSMIDISNHFDRDVKTTLNVMEAARKADSEFLIFLSTSAVYGDTKKIPTDESVAPNPISNYAEFKLLCEKIIEFYSRIYGMRSVSLRLANVVGKRSDHGVTVDLIDKLRDDPKVLELLGDGKQEKSYIYIDDVIDAILLSVKKAPKSYSVYNIGSADRISVDRIAEIIERKMCVSPRHVYKPVGGGRGWQGDTRIMQLDSSKIGKLGWKPKFNSSQAVSKAVEGLLEGS